MARVLATPGSAPIPVELSCDTLAIDGDLQRLTLSWRGRWEAVGDEQALASTRVLAALEDGVAKVDWAHVAQRPPIAAERPPRAEAPGESTLGLRTDQQAAAGARPVTPFAPPREAPPKAPAAPIPRRALEPGDHRRDAGVEARRGDPHAGRREARASGTAAAGRGPRDRRRASRDRRRAPRDGRASHGRRAAHVAAPPPVIARPPAVAPPHAVVAPPHAVVAAPPAVIAPPPRTPAPARPKKAQTTRDPDALARQLRVAGASDADVAALLHALHPPPPLPPDDD